MALVLFASAILLTVSISTVLADEGCGELLKNRCQKCHYLTRVCQKLEKDRQKKFFGGVFAGSWSRTIKNMIRHGAKLTADEQEKLTQCLDKASPEVLETCGIQE